MTVPAAVAQLVERFESHRDTYRSGRYNEAQLREEFLNPFFQALGWDVYNKRGYAEAYKEVIHEAAIKVGGRTKAPDYCFRVGGGVRSFFVEAKKPSVDIRDAVSPAYQLRRYAWSAKLPVSILTDFEEWAVYDCRIRPGKTDRASTARVMYHTYGEYPQCWDELYGLFSPEAIRRGSLDKFVASKRVKKGTAEVDDAFLGEIQTWRELLARNIALRNPKLSQRDLNFAVQRSIDRIVFLRICEDRGIEPYGALQTLLNGEHIYRRLAELFQRADDRYNSGLFHFTPEKGRPEPADELTLALSIDDRVLRGLIRDLYYPDSPYEFSVFPAEILGHVYEQFLGKVIRLTKGHRAVVEEKPEVKKAGGVYYTPAYIVDYIVQHTVGKLLGVESGEGRVESGKGKGESAKPPLPLAGERAGGCPDFRGAKMGLSPSGRRNSPDSREAKTGLSPSVEPKSSITPKQAAKLRILDPACGSGSFLIGAYEYLLKWHRDWYTADDPEKHARGRTPKLYRGRAGDWRLTTAERKRILLRNIHGVDIDPQAVEVTKLSLLLKVLEGESQETLSNQLRLFHERALPDLSANIKCGNSLIGPDFYQNRQMSLLDEEEVYRINTFDWQAEFPHIFPSPSGRGARGEGGFDAVIGNPPYRRESGYKDLLDEIACTPWGKKYRAARMDLWYYFVHRALELLKNGATLSFIVNAYWIASTGAQKLITTVRDQSHLEEIFFLGKLKVFEGVSGQHMVIRLTNGPSQGPTVVKLAQPSEERSAEPFVLGTAPIQAYEKSRDQLFRGGKVDLQPPADELFSRFDSCVSLRELGDVRQGIVANPPSVTKKANERYGEKWQVREGVFALRCNELAALRLPKSERVLLRPFHDLSDLGRYWLAEPPSLMLIYSSRETCPQIKDFPKIHKHLKRFQAIMEARRETRNGRVAWWHLHWPRDESIWNRPKIMCIRMAGRPSFVSARKPVYVPYTVNVFLPRETTREDLNFICGVLNSRVLWKWFQHNAKRRGVGLEIDGNVLNRAPIQRVDFSLADDVRRHDRIVELVHRMIELRTRVSESKTNQDRTVLRRQMEGVDRQIDRLVYELYELSDEEIAIVEEATRS